MYDGSSQDAIATFKSVVGRARLPSTVRLTRGRDIPAAAGGDAVELDAPLVGVSATGWNLFGPRDDYLVGTRR